MGQQAQPTGADTVAWKGDATGTFKVSSAYFAMKNGPRIESRVCRIWKLKVQPRFKNFAWLLMHNKILTAQNLRKRGYHIVGICYMCWNQDETAQHLFSECAQTMPVYSGVLREGRGYVPGQNNITEMVHKGTPKNDRELILTTNFIIWRERCNRTFRNEKKSIHQLIEEAIQQWRAAATSTQEGTNVE